MKIANFHLLFLTFGLIVPQLTFARGVLTAVQGDVEVFSNPGSQKKGPPPHVRYQDLYFSASKARVGMKVNDGSIIHTGPNGKARLIYPGGDQLIVPPASSVQIEYKEDSKASKLNLNLVYGKLRSVISPKGAHSSMRVKTPTAVAGVRGTDFHMAFAPQTGLTELTVLRGRVEMATAQSQPQSAVVEAGQSAKVSSAEVQTPVSAPTTKEALIEIAKESQVVSPPALSGPEKAEVEQLEKQALKTTLADIQKATPHLFNQLKAAGALDQVNNATVTQLAEQAPSTPKSKPTSKELDGDEDVYKRYFKKEN